MLTVHAFSPEELKSFIEMDVRACLPEEKLGTIVPLLEAVLSHERLPVWRRFLEKLTGPVRNMFASTLLSEWGSPESCSCKAVVPSGHREDRA